MAANAVRPNATLPAYPKQLAAEPFTCDSASVREGAALVMGASDNSVALPSAASVGGFIGFAVFAGSTSTGQTIYLVMSGDYPAIASGTITRGDRLIIADALGGVKTHSGPVTGSASIVGRALESATDGQRVRVMISPGASASASTIIQTFVAGTGGVTANRAAVIDSTADNQVVLPGGADPTSGVVGIALTTVLAGAAAFIVVYGPCSGVAAGAITRGDNLSIAAATGTVKLAAPATGANVQLIGYAQASISNTATGNIFVRPGMMQGA